MRTKRGQAKELPRGIRVRMMADGRKNPAIVLVGGKFHCACQTRDDALRAAHALAEKEREFGREVRAFDAREWRRYLDAKRMFFGDREPNWAELSRRAVTAASTLTVAEAVEKYHALRAGDGLGAGTLGQIKKKLERLVESFGDRALHEITPEDIRAWIGGMGFRPWTLCDHLKVCMTFWRAARREKWCSENPCEAVNAPRVPAEEVNILTVDEAHRLFSANQHEPCIGRLALEAFAGLRYSSAARIVADEIMWRERGIELPGKKHKSSRRHYIDGLPANLWRWLKCAPPACWTMTERQYLAAKADAFIRARVASTHNCLRHSFCTYHVAINRDAAATAVLMQHTSPAMLYRHYKGRASQRDARKYFAISPARNKPHAKNVSTDLIRSTHRADRAEKPAARRPCVSAKAQLKNNAANDTPTTCASTAKRPTKCLDMT